jgi:hypothetical protein
MVDTFTGIDRDVALDVAAPREKLQGRRGGIEKVVSIIANADRTDQQEPIEKVSALI